ncbi:YncE family protein [Streptosporangium roseum]|uniref:YncE family protein n=1 Tax=Streptosporangium roseum TaxID=2001 RepID=UPI00331710C0
MQRLRSRRQRHVVLVPLIGLAACALSACGGGPAPGSPGRVSATGGVASAPADGSAAPGDASARPALPGAAPRTTPTDVYAHDRPGMLSPAVAEFPERVYVPNSESDTVTVIDPRTYRVLRTLKVGRRPQHVVPSWDLKTLWVNNDGGDSLTPIDPMTGRPGRPVSVDDPYNLYFTPDGRNALVMAERENRLDFLNPRTMRLRRSLHMPCKGVNHADFTADGKTMLASCEFSGRLVAVDMRARKVRAVVDLADGTTRRRDIRHGGTRHRGTRDGGLPHRAKHGSTRHGSVQHGSTGHGFIQHGSTGHDLTRNTTAPPGSTRHGATRNTTMPQDVKLSPDGTTFYVADMAKHGVWLVDAGKLRVTGFIRTGRGAHGLHVSRDSKVLYVSNSDAGSVTVVSFALRRPVDTWRVPGGGSPDMGGVSADGSRLWLSGRHDGVVYVFDTGDGRLIRKIDVGAGPHGLAVYPQPGRYSLGHTGVFR